MRNFTNKPMFTCRNGLGQLCTYDRSTGAWSVLVADGLAWHIKGALPPPADPPQVAGVPDQPDWYRVSVKSGCGVFRCSIVADER